MRRVPELTPILVVLALFGACLGARNQRDGCACGPEPSRPAEAVAPPASGTVKHEEEVAETPQSEASLPPPDAPPSLPDFTDPSWTRVPSRAGKYLLCWRSLTGNVPRNEDFELEVWVLRDGQPARDALLSVSGWMPDHGHGMLRQPRAEVRTDGSFRVEGMLLHMRGHWQLFFEVLEGNLSETAECALDL